MTARTDTSVDDARAPDRGNSGTDNIDPNSGPSRDDVTRETNELFHKDVYGTGSDNLGTHSDKNWLQENAIGACSLEEVKARTGSTEIASKLGFPDAGTLLEQLGGKDQRPGDGLRSPGNQTAERSGFGLVGAAAAAAVAASGDDHIDPLEIQQKIAGAAAITDASIAQSMVGSVLASRNAGLAADGITKANTGLAYALYAGSEAGLADDAVRAKVGDILNQAYGALGTQLNFAQMDATDLQYNQKQPLDRRPGTSTVA